MAVKADGNGDLFLHGGNIFCDLVREHGAGGIHDGDAIHALGGQHGGLIRQFLRCADVGFHQRVAAGQAGILYHVYGVYRLPAVAGGNTDAQERQLVRGSQRHTLRRSLCRQQEHTQSSLLRIGLHQTHIPLVIQRGRGASVIGADALGVAQLDILNTAAEQILYHAFRQLRRKAVADNICAVAQRTIKQFHSKPLILPDWEVM